MNEQNRDQQDRQRQQMQQGDQEARMGQQQNQQGGTNREDEPIIGRDERDRESLESDRQEEADLGDVEFESDMDDEGDRASDR